MVLLVMMCVKGSHVSTFAVLTQKTLFSASPLNICFSCYFSYPSISRPSPLMTPMTPAVWEKFFVKSHKRMRCGTGALKTSHQSTTKSSFPVQVKGSQCGGALGLSLSSITNSAAIQTSSAKFRILLVGHLNRGCPLGSELINWINRS